MRRAISHAVRQKFFLIFVFLVLIEGIPFSILYWIPRSSEKNARIGGYSLERLFIGIAGLLILAGLAGVIIISIKKPEYQKKINEIALKNLSHPFVRQGSLIVSGVVLFALVTYFSWSASHIDPGSFSTAVFLKIYPIILWAVLFLLEWVGLQIWICLFILQPAVAPKEILTSLLITFLSYGLLWQWVTLVFHINWPLIYQLFGRGAYTGFTPLHYVISLVWGISGIALLHWGRKKGYRYYIFLCLVIWGYLGQLVIPIRDSQHVDDALTRFTEAPISHILYSVCSENPGYSRILTQYEKYKSTDFWLGTKPPGYFLFYSALADLGSGLSGKPCDTSLPSSILYLFPFLAVLTLLPLSKISQAIFKEIDPLTSIMLFTLPGFVYHALVADQALFPLLFMLTAWLTFVTIQRANMMMAILLGIILYVDVFITFSLLPVAGFVCVWVLLNWLISSRERRGLLTRQTLLIFLGFFATYLIILIFGRYDPWVRYQNAFISHREIKNFSFELSQFSTTISLNNFEFLFWIGFPIGFLFLTNVIDAFRKMLRRIYTPAVLFSLTTFIIFVILNLIGQTRGEVGRLWLFITPMVVLLAGDSLHKMPNWVQDTIILLQSLTTILFFQFFYIL